MHWSCQVYLIFSLLLVALALVPVRANVDENCPVTCPSHLYAHRSDENFAITCQVGELDHVVQMKWFIHSDTSSNNLSIDLGQSEKQFSFQSNESAGEVSLILQWIEKPIDYANYSLHVWYKNEQGDCQRDVKLLERGTRNATFHWWDYLIFATILLLSAGIGVYYGFFDKSANSQEEYMLGGRQMGWFPVSMSLLASFMSAITVLGTPVETFNNGSQYIFITVAFPIALFLAANFFWPIFYRLGLTSAYEYLEMRFCRLIRVFGAILFVIQMVFYMSMVLYVPSIAMEKVIKVNFWFSALTTAIVCIFYTSMGGMKATMWTDAFQVILMIAGIVIIFVKSLINEGGFGVAWENFESRGRAELFNLSFDPRYRHTVWSTIFGGTLTWLFNYGVNQAQVQRGLSARTLKTGQLALAINAPLLIVVLLIPALCGVLIFSRFKDCDPVLAGNISKKDQLAIFYVMNNISEDLPGIPGLFMATLFAAALSSLSSGINGLAAVTCRDFGVEKFLKKFGMNENQRTWVAKGISVIYGVICILLIFLIQLLPQILDSALGLFGAVGGPLLGVYISGIFFPWINSIGAGCGLISSLILTFWFTIGSKTHEAVAHAQRIPSRSTMFCDASLAINRTFYPEQPENFDSLTGMEHFYSISYLYMSVLGVVVSITVGLIVSAFTGFTRGRVLQSNFFNPTVVKIVQKLNIRTWERPEVEKGFQPDEYLVDLIDKPFKI